MVVGAAPSLPGVAFFVPLEGRSRLIAGNRVQVYRWTDRTRRWDALVRGNPWPGGYGTHREALATDALDPARVYVGTTTGRLFCSADAGARWDPLPYSFPAIHSVAVSGPDP
jgi:hypothetical protein